MRALLLRDIKLAMRAGGGFGLALAFFLVLVVLVPFGLGSEPAQLASVAPGILWIGALLACLLSLDRLFQLDYEDGALDHLALAPIPLAGVVLAKATAHWLTTALPLIIVAPFLGALLNLPNEGYFWLVVSLIVGSPSLSVIGAFGAALCVGLKRGSLLLSLLVLPLYVPTLIFGMEIVRRGISGQETSAPLALLTAISLGCLAILPFAAAQALRANLR